MAKRAFPDGSPLGRTISLAGQSGVRGRRRGGRRPLRPGERRPAAHGLCAVRAAAMDAASAACISRCGPRASRRRSRAPVRSLVRELDPNLPLINVQTQEAVIDDQLRRERLFANLSTAFGGIALLLACIGIYGVVAYSAARRTAEIGIRVALGAQVRQHRGAGPSAHAWFWWCWARRWGPLARWPLTKFIASMLYNVEPARPVDLRRRCRASDSDGARGGLPSRPPRRPHRSDDRSAERVTGSGPTACPRSSRRADR